MPFFDVEQLVNALANLLEDGASSFAEEQTVVHEQRRDCTQLAGFVTQDKNRSRQPYFSETGLL
jgi:hypothetical protein